MTSLDLLHALHESPFLIFHRVEGELLEVFLHSPDSARFALDRFKDALFRALEENEQLEASVFLSSPHRLAALLAHALGVEAPVVLTGYYGEEPRRYLAPAENLTPYLAWAERNLSRPRRLHLSPTTGEWVLDWREGWEVALEAVAGRTRYSLLYPEKELRGWLEGARDAFASPEGVSLWRPGSGPVEVRDWTEAFDTLAVDFVTEDG